MSENHVHKTSFPFNPIRFEGNMHYVADCSAAATVQLVTHTLHTCTNTPTCQLTKSGQMYLYTVWTPAKVDSAFGRSATEQISEAKSPAVFQRHTRVSGSDTKPNTNTRDTREIMTDWTTATTDTLIKLHFINRYSNMKMNENNDGFTTLTKLQLELDSHVKSTKVAESFCLIYYY